MGKGNRNRKRREIRTVDVGNDTFAADIRHGGNYGGRSFALVPIAVNAASPEEANAKLAAAFEVAQRAIEEAGADTRLTTEGDFRGLVMAAEDAAFMWRKMLEGIVARKSRRN